jgi:mannose-6-phosphate isomerase-like protein (cupin superfamily)
MATTPVPYVRTHAEGESIWFLGTLMTIKAGTAETAGQFSLIEQTLPLGFAPPLHVHHAEDEAFYILEGSFTFYCGDQTLAAPAGSFVYLPKDLPHSFRVDQAPARLLQWTIPAGFERFHVEVGEPAPQLTLPPPGPPAVDKLLALAPNYQVEILGPPPGW